MKIALVTAPQDEARALALRTVESGLAACVNILPGVTSVYRWRGKVKSDAEALLIVKTADENAEKLVARVRSWHSYECPEVILVDVVGGNPDYLAWISDPDGEGGETAGT